MRRACAILASGCLLLIVGCRDYDLRLGKTLEEMKYQQRLEKNLEKAPTKGLLQQESIYVRPPKGLAGPAKAFALGEVDPGKFDLTESYVDGKKSSLHVLARHKKLKAPPKKGVKAVEPAPRGDFTNEVIELIKAVYAVEDLPPSKLKAVSKGHGGRDNGYREAKLNLGEKEVLIYLYGDKNNPYNVALIFDYPKTEVNNLSPKIGLSLEAFAVGEPANRAFSGGSPEEGGRRRSRAGQCRPRKGIRAHRVPSTGHTVRGRPWRPAPAVGRASFGS